MNNNRHNIYKHSGYDVITGKTATTSGLIERLSKLNIETALHLIGITNRSVTEHKANPILQKRLCTLLLPPETIDQIRRTEGKLATTLILFHRQQQLLLQKLALLVCSPKPGLNPDTEERHAFGTACLMANSILEAKGESDHNADNRIKFATDLMPVFDLADEHGAFGIIGRARRLWLEIAPSLTAEKDYVDVLEHFRGFYGVGLGDFMDAVYVIYTYLAQFNPNDGDCGKWLIVDMRNFLTNITFSADDFLRILSLISLPVASANTSLITQPSESLLHDFTLLKAHPLIQLDQNRYLCCDTVQLIKFLTDGLYWKIMESLPTQDEGKFRSFFGTIFATYLGTVIAELYGPPTPNLVPRHAIAPSFADHSELCDALIDGGDKLLLAEFKGVILTKEAKYSGRAQILERDIVAKFAKKGSKPEDRKGVLQLANSIRKLSQGARVNLRGFNIQNYKRIIPIIISYDPAATCPLIPNFLDERFRRELGELPQPFPSIGPIRILSTREFEVIDSIGRCADICSVINDFSVNANDLTTFWNYVTSMYEGKILTDESLLSRANKAAAVAATRRFFSGATIESAEGSIQIR